ncbi:MAG TPA: thioredoxin family protein [Bacteroidetes bacterium]|nr:thioredoxin family protein [Bacteroidota bacterium]
MKKIEILGVGCPKCQKTEEEVRKAALSLGWGEGVDFTIAKITNPGEIASRGVLMTPGVVVDGKVVSTGKVPKMRDIVGWLL